MIIFLSDSNINHLLSAANNELKLLHAWFESNRLSVNISKCNYIVFRTPKLKYCTPTIDLKLNDHSLQRVNFAKFLGVYIDENLNWKHHIDEIALKIAKNNGVLTKLKYYLPTFVLLKLYNSFISPYLSYCSCIWSSANVNTKLNKLAIAQKRAVRSVAKVKPNSHCDPWFKKFSILKLSDIYTFQILQIVYKFNNRMLPSAFNDYFNIVSKSHSHCTRSSTNLSIPFARTNIRQKTLKITGPLLYNRLSTYIKSAPSVSIFKHNLKHHLISLY